MSSNANQPQPSDTPSVKEMTFTDLELMTLEQLSEFIARHNTLERENAALRRIISESAAAIGNGSTCAPDASVDFMGYVPYEIKTASDAQAKRIAELERVLKDSLEYITDSFDSGESTESEAFDYGAITEHICSVMGQHGDAQTGAVHSGES